MLYSNEDVVIMPDCGPDHIIRNGAWPWKMLIRIAPRPPQVPLKPVMAATKAPVSELVIISISMPLQPCASVTSIMYRPEGKLRMS